MVKAVFIDYTGTLVQEDEPYTRKLIAYFMEHSDVKDPRQILSFVWSKVKEIEAESYGPNFAKIDERTDRILAACVEQCGLCGDLAYMHEIWSKIWVHAPLFDDVKTFFERCKVPIYVLSNDDSCYLEESFRLKGLRPAGIISAETAQACKPHLDIFRKALEVAGVSADEPPRIILKVMPPLVTSEVTVTVSPSTISYSVATADLISALSAVTIRSPFSVISSEKMALELQPAMETARRAALSI